MFKSIADKVFCFDIEWIPDPLSGELLHGIEPNPPFSYEESFMAMWADAGATPEKPRPFVKTALCRIVSICGVFRDGTARGRPDLKLVSIPSDVKDPKWDEAHILEVFLKAVGQNHPQLVGYNSHSSDVPIVVQRSIVHGLDSYGFAERPEKPWLGMDYFGGASSDASIDLGQIIAMGRWGGMPRLDEIATLSGIPGKIDVNGANVWKLWLEGRLQEIVDYNDFDALTTYLLWARMAHFAGLLSDRAYEVEQECVRELIEREIGQGKEHLKRYLARWDELTVLMKERRGHA